MRGVLLPLAIYLAVTLGVPLVNGAAARSEFWRHAAEVIVVVGLLLTMRMIGALVRPTRSAVR